MTTEAVPRRRTWTATVVSARMVTPAMRRIVLGGSGLETFTVPPGALGPYCKLFLGSGEDRAPVRTYSVRRHDPARAELHVDILLHDAAGPGGRFGCSASVGESVTLGGPGFIPAEPCAAYLLAGDHTALPAIAHILEHLPAEARARVVVEVPGPGERQEMTSAAAAEVEWLDRPPGRPSRLPEAVRASWPRDDGDLLLWAGAEAAIARAIRVEARTARRLAPARCQVLNYWKAGQPEGRFSYVD